MGAYGGFNVNANTRITVNIMKLLLISSYSYYSLLLAGNGDFIIVLSLASQAILSGVLLLAILA